MEEKHYKNIIKNIEKKFTSDPDDRSKLKEMSNDLGKFLVNKDFKNSFAYIERKEIEYNKRFSEAKLELIEKIINKEN